MIRGAVYPIDLGKPYGHEQGGKRLGLVISINGRAWSVVTVIPTSTSAQPAIFRPEIEIAEFKTLLLVDQIRTIDTRRIVGDPVDYLSHLDLRNVEWVLSEYLGL